MGCSTRILTYKVEDSSHNNNTTPCTQARLFFALRAP